jgi:hypothetical protein
MEVSFGLQPLYQGKKPSIRGWTDTKAILDVVMKTNILVLAKNQTQVTHSVAIHLTD